MKYKVGLQVGGLMENPEIRFVDIEMIEASSPKEAEDIYNKKHSCNYFYACCLGGE